MKFKRLPYTQEDTQNSATMEVWQYRWTMVCLCTIL